MKDKIYHMAHMANEKGDVSALCFKQYRPINLKVASWTNREKAVTCPKCLKQMRDGEHEFEMLEEV